jgi:hypothetical protein
MVPPTPLNTRRHRSCRATASHIARVATRAGFSLLATLIAVTAAVSSFEIATAPAAGAANWAPVHAGDFPDPSILHWNGVYYGFATQNFASASQTINIQVSTSSDGVNWTSNGTNALPTVGSWAEPGNTWAPSVAFNGAEFVMYYTATDISSGDQCIGEATASAPLGPYTDTNPNPITCMSGAGGSIDPDIFTNPQTGVAYLIWKNDGNRIGTATGIWSAPLAPNLFSLTGGATEILNGADESWQSGVIEGPDMVYVSGGFYLFYAGGPWGTTTYALGWASCAGPSGPCTDQSSSPLLTSAPGMSGPGGPGVFTLPSGQLVMAFAAWQGNTIGYLSCGIRPMYLADLSFSGGTPTLSPNNPGESPAASPSCPPGPPPPPPGYWQVASDGGVFTFGAAGFYGSTGSMRLNRPVVGLAPTPDRRGYWLVASDGGVFAYGDAGFYGSTGSIVLNKPIIGMIPTLDGHGYWLIASDGGVFAYGDAPFYGSAASDNLGYPVTAAAPSFLGGGYWMTDANGQVLPYGNAVFEGQPAFAPGGYRITGMTGTLSSHGYWLTSANGNVADFGDAAPYGSMYGQPLNAPVVGIAPTADHAGYWLQGGDGGIFTFGDAPFLGSMGGKPLNAPMVGIAGT